MAYDDHTTVIQGWLDRLQAGDETARAELIGCACDRLTRLVRKMLRDFPGVARWAEAEDVLQNALVRLDRALKTISPTTVRDFFRLAATQVRRELLDLARRYSGPLGVGANHATWVEDDQASGKVPGAVEAQPETTFEPGRLAAWTDFHRAVEGLPEADREIIDLMWYQGLGPSEVAGLLGISDRTVNRRWNAARLRLVNAVGSEPPV